MVLRVGFLRRGFILAVLKDAGTMPEVREGFRRSSWFPALCVGGEGESVKSKVERLVSSGECNFSGRMLKSPRITSGVPFSGKQLRRASISS